MAYVPQFENDIYISYAHVDNSHDRLKRGGWVDLFHEHLDLELVKQLGKAGVIKILRDVHGYERFSPNTENKIKNSALFVAVLSNGYLASQPCLKELKMFKDAAEAAYGVRVSNHPRILPVHLQNIPARRWPLEIIEQQIFGHPFYQTGLDKDPGKPADPGTEVFEQRIKSLAREILETLKILKVLTTKEVPVLPTSHKAAEHVRPAESAVFISYRRGEGTPYARLLHDQLVAHFGANRVFIDLDAIEPGDDFVEVITNYVSSCSILIALINKTWLEAKDDEGRRRLDNPDDFVNLEISIALQRKIRVIPVLVQGASMPRTQELPQSLSPLSRRNALEVSDLRWKQDVGTLIKVLEKYL